MELFEIMFELRYLSTVKRKCVVCGEPLENNHKCSKESEARFNHNLANRQYARLAIKRQRYGEGLTFDEKLDDAFNVFNCEQQFDDDQAN
jgi:hypothetical protein